MIDTLCWEAMNRLISTDPTVSARPAGRVFFPLDERIGLLAHSTFSPRVHKCVVRLGTELPFERVPDLARMLLGVNVSVDTVRRLTEAAGAAQVEREEALCQQVRREAPDGPGGPAVQQLSADGAMVPVTGGEWVEVRTIALGAVEKDEDGVPHTRHLRYFSRLCSAAAFIDWVALPLHEAGTAQAGTVVAVQDGADWLTQLLDAHCPDAVRILDFPHAAEHLTMAAQAAYGAGKADTSAWLDTWFHALKHGDPDAVIAAVRALPAPSAEAAAVRDGAAQYLSRRRHQIAYADFQKQGYPIGSGAVESANKLVVEQRLKGSGMHWSRRNVTPMLALRAIACNGEWEQVWPALWQHLCTQARERHRQRSRQRREARREQEVQEQAQSLPAPRTPVLPKDPPMVVDGRPTAAHHWSHGYDQQLIVRARHRART
jgi:hypothetical protein